MSISTNYDSSSYTWYLSQLASARGQGKVNLSDFSRGSASTLKLTADSAQGTSDKKFNSPLDSLVEAGTITEDQEKAVRDALEASRMAHGTQMGSANAAGSFKNPLDSLVEAGTITKDQEDAIKSAFESGRKAHRMAPPPMQFFQQDGNSDPIEDVLDNLVSSGTINGDQEGAIKSALKSALKAYETQAGMYEDDVWSTGKSGTV